jgi:hypothetical protein
MQSETLHAPLIENADGGLHRVAGGDAWENLRSRQWLEALATFPARQYHAPRETPATNVQASTRPVGTRYVVDSHCWGVAEAGFI